LNFKIIRASEHIELVIKRKLRRSSIFVATGFNPGVRGTEDNGASAKPD